MALRVIALSCLVFLLSLMSFASMATSTDERQYLVRVQTGDRIGAGTDSQIILKLFNSSSDDSYSYTIDRLTDHNYFERGNLDVFSHSAPCLSVCGITVTSDNSGYKSGWYLDYVEVTVSGSVSKKISFPADQWLALSEWPKQLSVTKDLCSWFTRLKPTLSSVRPTNPHYPCRNIYACNLA